MIKFFRKTRQNLLSEGKTVKYLKYAIGEIVLVVIGILIALQVNNWNEDRKDLQLLQNYYSQLLEDFNNDSININNKMNRIKSSFEGLNSYFRNFDSTGVTIESLITKSKKMNVTSSSIQFESNTLQVLKSTGDIRLMPSSIRNRLTSLESSQNSISYTIGENDKLFLDALLMLTYKYPVFYWTDNISTDLKKALNKNNDSETLLAIGNALKLKQFSEFNKIQSLTGYLEKVQKLKKLIEAELK